MPQKLSNIWPYYSYFGINISFGRDNAWCFCCKPFELMLETGPRLERIVYVENIIKKDTIRRRISFEQAFKKSIGFFNLTPFIIAYLLSLDKIYVFSIKFYEKHSYKGSLFHQLQAKRKRISSITFYELGDNFLISFTSTFPFIVALVSITDPNVGLDRCY